MMLATVAALSVAMSFGHDDGGQGSTDPATRIANRVAYLNALLALTDAQETQAATI